MSAYSMSRGRYVKLVMAADGQYQSVDLTVPLRRLTRCEGGGPGRAEVGDRRKGTAIAAVEARKTRVSCELHSVHSAPSRRVSAECHLPLPIRSGWSVVRMTSDGAGRRRMPAPRRHI